MTKTGPSIDRKNSKQDYATPWSLIRACEKRYWQFGIDLAADDDNAKAAEYFTIEDDSLSKSWPRGSYWNLCWLNPPFCNIAPWAKKCYEESKNGSQILFLTPASVGSNWFRDYIYGKVLVLALNGRITFEGATQPYPKDCMISAFGFGQTGFEVWNWRE